MKNFQKLIFIALSLIVLFCIGCAKTNLEYSTQSVLSEYRKNLFVGKGSSFVATFTSGQREKDYVMDGVCSSLVDFGVVTLKFENYVLSSLPKFELKVNEDIFAGELEHNPYDGSFVFDIERQVEDGDILILYLVDYDEYVNLDCWSNTWQCDYKKAKEIFCDKYKAEIQQNTEENVLKGEMYIKIVSDDKEFKNIYWYVLLVCQNGNMYSVLIDVNNCQIVQN